MSTLSLNTSIIWRSTDSTSSSPPPASALSAAVDYYSDNGHQQHQSHGVDAANDNDEFRALVALLVMMIALIGILVNVFITFVSARKIRGDYRMFVANLSVVDILCAVLFAFMGYVNLSDRARFSSRVMTYSAFAFYGSFGVMICALVPISLSRIVAASMPKTYDRLFSGRRALAICLVADVCPLLLLFVICTARHDAAHWLFVGYATITVAAYLVTFAFNALVFRIVAKHIRVVECLHDRTRLIETQQVALATLAQALIPLVCQVPAFLTLSSALLLVQPLTDGSVIVVTQLWLAASPLFDALITLCVIKQYRIQAKAYCARPVAVLAKVLCRGDQPHRQSAAEGLIIGEDNAAELGGSHQQLSERLLRQATKRKRRSTAGAESSAWRRWRFYRFATRQSVGSLETASPPSLEMCI